MGILALERETEGLLGEIVGDLDGPSRNKDKFYGNVVC